MDDTVLTIVVFLLVFLLVFAGIYYYNRRKRGGEQVSLRGKRWKTDPGYDEPVPGGGETTTSGVYAKSGARGLVKETPRLFRDIVKVVTFPIVYPVETISGAVMGSLRRTASNREKNRETVAREKRQQKTSAVAAKHGETIYPDSGKKEPSSPFWKRAAKGTGNKLGLRKKGASKGSGEDYQ